MNAGHNADARNRALSSDTDELPAERNGYTACVGDNRISAYALSHRLCDRGQHDRRYNGRRPISRISS